MAAPTLVASYEVLGGATTLSLSTPSFTPGDGEVIIVKAATESFEKPSITGVSGGGLTYTSRMYISQSAHCEARLWSAIVSGSPGSMSVTVTFGLNDGYHSMVVERWSNATLAASPAVLNTIATSAPSATLVTEADDSVISWICADWNANAPGTPAYRSGAVQTGIHDQSTSFYVAYYAYQTTTTAGSQTVGLTSPGNQEASMGGIEIQGSAAVGYRSSSNTGNDQFVSVLSPAVPSGASSGDVIVAVLGRWESINPAVTAPSGFTEAGSQITSGNAKMNIYWKRLTGSDTGTYTFSWSGSMWSHVHCFCMTGVKSTGDPIGPYINSWTGTAGTYGTTQLTTSFVPGLIWSSYNDTGGTHTPPTNFTEVIDFDSGAGAYYLPGMSGTHSAANASVTTSSNAIAALIGLSPEIDGDAPSVTTQAVTDITPTTATGHGTVVGDGGDTITERGICWSTSPNPTTSDNKATAAGTTGAYSASITGLSNGTLYHVRAYAINNVGTSYGADVTFIPYAVTLSWIAA